MTGRVARRFTSTRSVQGRSCPGRRSIGCLRVLQHPRRAALYEVGLVLIPAYWIGGAFLLRFLDRVVIEPRLDSRYPLAVRERQTSS